MVLEYIRAHPSCTKTSVKNAMPFTMKTTDKILKQLIEQDQKVIYYIDKVNPRIHHLLISDKDKSKMINQLLGQFTTVELTTGEKISFPVNRNRFPVINAIDLDTIKNLIAGTKWYNPS
jgi:hypothetical protein